MQLVSLDRVLGLQWLVSGVNGGFLLTMRADLHHLIQAHASYFPFFLFSLHRRQRQRPEKEAPSCQ